MQVLATVQGQAHWIYDREWEVLTAIARYRGARVAAILPSASVVYERVMKDLIDRGWIFLQDTETRPLDGPKVYLTKEGEAAVDTARAWVKSIGSSKRGKKR